MVEPDVRVESEASDCFNIRFLKVSRPMRLQCGLGSVRLVKCPLIGSTIHNIIVHVAFHDEPTANIHTTNAIVRSGVTNRELISFDLGRKALDQQGLNSE